MSNAVRLVNGGTIQVRTGVLQGIGPQGPTGPVGATGPDGPQGLVGPAGPMGQILQIQSKTIVGGTTSVAPNTDTMVAFGNVAYDDISCISSSSNLIFNTAGDYYFTLWVRFDVPASAATGHRTLWLQSATDALTIHRASCTAVANEPTYHQIAASYRVLTPGETINVFARSGDTNAVGISAGALTITRAGSGPAGPVGPAGPQGNVGAVGPQGVPGPVGNASAGFATYGAIG